VVFAAGSYADVGEPEAGLDDTRTNWRTGAYYNFKLPNGSLHLGLQYETAEIGTFDSDINSEGGTYLIGSIDYRTGIIAIGGWVGNYASDIEQDRRYFIDNEWVDEDAISFAIGIKAFLGNHAMLFGGYRQVDSDNDYRDENIFLVGMRYSF
jgi:predicted porin